jgi:carboxyl-terminal processing protease
LIIACVITAVVAAASVIVGFYCAIGGSEGAILFAKVNTVRRIIDSRYVGDTDWTDIAEGAADGMIEALGDRWSYYMTASEYSAYTDRVTNTSNGIGVTIKEDEATGGFEIISVTADSPAEAAGLVPGQIIVSAAGVSTDGMSASQLRELILAQDGDFTLEVLDGEERISLTIRTDSFYASPVQYRLLDGEIGYIRIANFEQGAAENAVAAIKALEEQGMRALIFDVRSNPGGRLSELIDLLDYILPEGEIFISVDRDGSEKVYTSDEDCISFPMAVLINENTYSAAEFFAAALREYDYAAIVGQASTGKGRSQETFSLSDGSAVHISTRRYLTPNRVDLSEQGGLIPDISVEIGTNGDNQLLEATKYLS